jgi:hypothetical protein
MGCTDAQGPQYGLQTLTNLNFPIGLPITMPISGNGIGTQRSLNKSASKIEGLFLSCFNSIDFRVPIFACCNAGSIIKIAVVENPNEAITEKSCGIVDGEMDQNAIYPPNRLITNCKAIIACTAKHKRHHCLAILH